MRIDVKQFKDLYINLVDNIPKKLKNDLCVFFPQIGKNYHEIKDSQKILFIGKSVNSWITNGLNIEKLFESNNEERIVNRDDEIYWVERNDNPDYNSNNSAFWRLIKSVTKRYFKVDDWYKNIAWTNLYKVSSWKGGNPSAYLRKIQTKMCINILNKEIEYFNPKYIIFLTSYWETFYLKSIGYNNKNNESIKWDKYKTYYQKYNGRIFILSQHPQGKKEEPHIKAISEILKII